MFLSIMNLSKAQNINISGSVTDGNNVTLPSVSIMEKGTDNGIVTDSDGNYSISVSSNDATLVFSFIGMKTQEIQINNRSVINVQLFSDAENLDEVVVTALGMKREKKALGYAMQEIKSEELNKTMNPNINGALEGKVAGVIINASAGGAGSSSKVTIRGNSSISRSNEPLWIVDGIPLNDDQQGTASEWGGIERAGGAQDINPDDIASISVLKGPNASALYGSRATNGVILITTKSGKNSDGLGVSYNGSYTINKPYDILEYQEKYSQGLNGVFDSASSYSWGEEITGQEVESWRYPGETYALSSEVADRVDNFYRTGIAQNHNIAFDYGTENVKTRFNIGYNEDQGVSEKLFLKKYNFGAKVNAKISKLIDVDSKVNYIRSSGKDRESTGLFGLYLAYAQLPITIRDQDLKNPYDENGDLVSYIPQSSDDVSPYFELSQRNNYDIKHRLIGHFGVTFNFTDKFKLKVKHGMDYYNYTYESIKPEDPIKQEKGTYSKSTRTFLEENSSALLTYNDRLNDFSFGVSVGANRMNRKTNRLNANSGEILIEDNYFLSNGTQQTVVEALTEKEIHSVYSLINVGYKDFLFLDLTGRNDWSSTLPEDNWSYFYPSASLSCLVSEAIELPEWINLLKTRIGFSEVGNDTDAYTLMETLYIESKYNLIPYVKIPDSKSLADLKPEETESSEFGLDARFFGNRLGLDFTYYKSSTFNQIIQVDVPMSSGYQKELINAGEISNNGFEVMLYGTVLKTKDWTLDLTLNWSKNENKVEELHERLDKYLLGQTETVQVWAIEGEDLGQIYGTKYLRNETGDVIIDSNGLPKQDQEKKLVGNINPDWFGSIRTDLSWKNFSLSALINIKQGGDILSKSEAELAKVGNAEITENRGTFVFPGVYEDGTRNVTNITTEEFYTYVGGRNCVAEEFMYDASYIKLQEISISYKLPRSICKRIDYIQSAKFSIVGRNLGYLSKDTPGSPEGTFNRSVTAQALDCPGVPVARTYGFNLSIQF